MSTANSTPRNTRHGIHELNVMRDLMVHEGQTHEHQTINISSSGHNTWGLPRRGRNEEYHNAKGREGLSKGFAGFYGSEDKEASTRDGHLTHKQNTIVGDTARRHFEQKPSEEQKWIKGFKTTFPDILPPKPRGKKPVAPVDTRPPFEEISDIPRGKKHVKQPQDQLSGGGVPVAAEPSGNASHNGNKSEFSRKRLVMDESKGVPVAWKGPPFFAPSEADETLFEGLRNRTVQRTEAQKRNGIPCKVPGDLPYKNVEQAPNYVQSINPTNSKCGYEKAPKPFVFNDKFSIKEGTMRRAQEISDVRQLPNY